MADFIGSCSHAGLRRQPKWRTSASGGVVIGGTDVPLTCPICEDVMFRPVKTLCNHRFCQACLVQWLKRVVHGTCPLCRAELPPISSTAVSSHAATSSCTPLPPFTQDEELERVAITILGSRAYYRRQLGVLAPALEKKRRMHRLQQERMEEEHTMACSSIMGVGVLAGTVSPFLLGPAAAVPLGVELACEAAVAGAMTGCFVSAFFTGIRLAAWIDSSGPNRCILRDPVQPKCCSDSHAVVVLNMLRDAVIVRLFAARKPKDKQLSCGAQRCGRDRLESCGRPVAECVVKSMRETAVPVRISALERLVAEFTNYSNVMVYGDLSTCEARRGQRLILCELDEEMCKDEELLKDSCPAAEEQAPPREREPSSRGGSVRAISLNIQPRWRRARLGNTPAGSMCREESRRAFAQCMKERRRFDSRLWICRHGEKEERTARIANWHLRVTPEGLQDVEACAKKLLLRVSSTEATCPWPRRIVSSPFPRCVVTAGIFAKVLGMPSICIEPGLCELLTPDRGVQGLEPAVRAPTWTVEELRQQLANTAGANGVGVDETYEPSVPPSHLRACTFVHDRTEVQERVGAVVQDIFAGALDFAVLVTHGPVAYRLVRALTGESDFGEPPPGSITELIRAPYTSSCEDSSKSKREVGCKWGYVESHEVPSRKLSSMHGRICE